MPNASTSAVKGNASILSFFSKASGNKSENSESEDVMDLDSNEDAKQSTVQVDASSDPSGMSDDDDIVPVVKREKPASSKTRPPITNRLPQKSKDTPHSSNLPPLSEISLMFKDIVNRCPAIVEFAKKLRGRPLRVATMCSGTEAPLLALGLVSRALREDHDTMLEVEHVFSCEIEPFKQAYIERNFRPPILFRDVCELGDDEACVLYSSQFPFVILTYFMPSRTTAYGALVPVPGNVDMLIAGTSCVDYSTLNNEKKDIDANGESGRTFRGMLSWVQKHRPKVVILENVCSAPWDRVVKKFSDIMYSAAHLRLDTKNYYIPHTRTRGYLVAIDERKSSIPEKWKRRVAELVRPASSTLDAFLLESDDPRIHHARQALVSETVNHERKAGYDWGRCESRHIKARHDEQLGNRRPLTNWEEGALEFT
jgi:site-specific DNA-cytosine methylase